MDQTLEKIIEEQKNEISELKKRIKESRKAVVEYRERAKYYQETITNLKALFSVHHQKMSQTMDKYISGFEGLIPNSVVTQALKNYVAQNRPRFVQFSAEGKNTLASH